MRDSLTAPTVIQAAGNLSIRGDQGIDILTLNHPDSGFQSGGNLSLVSDGVISGDAHFASGGNFSILNLSGQAGNLISLYDPIISSDGDVTFGSYTGVSLKVEAKGSITVNGDITITGPDTTLSLFKGWTTTGDVSFGTVDFAKPISGTSEAVLNLKPSENKPSSISTTFSAKAGDTVAFNWKFLTYDNSFLPPSNFNSASATIKSLSTGQTIAQYTLDYTDTSDNSVISFGNRFSRSTALQSVPSLNEKPKILNDGDYTLRFSFNKGQYGSTSQLIVKDVSPQPLLVSDRSLLANNSTLILRAGVTTLQDPPANVPKLNMPTLSTNFIASEKPSPGNITVTGNITNGDVTNEQSPISGPVILSSSGSVTLGTALHPPSTGDVKTTRGSIIITATGSIATKDISTGGLNADGSVPRNYVALTSAIGDIQVSTIDAGSGGINVSAGRAFRAIGAEPLPFINEKTAERSNLIDFLVEQGYSRTQLEKKNFSVESTSLPASLLVRPDGGSAKITIRTGNASQTIVDNSYSSISVDSNQPFVVGPVFTNSLEFIPANPIKNLAPYNSITNPNGFDINHPFDFKRVFEKL